MIVEIVLLVLIIFTLHKYFKKPDGIPPGEWGLPLIGHLPPSSIEARKYFEDLRKKHGDIYSIKMGGRLNVVISDYALAKAAFNKPELTGRPDFYTFRVFMFFDNLGIAGSEGRVWQDNRRFALHALRDYGMGKSSIEGTIITEVEAILKELDKKLGEPFELSWIINVAILNVIWSLIGSKRYDVNDPKILDFANTMSEMTDSMQGPMKYLDMFPALVPFVPEFIKSGWMKVGICMEGMNKLFDFVREAVEEHRETLDVDNPRDYIDSYLMEIEKQKEDPNTTFKSNYQDLLISVTDLFFAGSETTSNSIRYTFLYMINFPDIQKKIQEEIDEHVPRDRMPNLDDRKSLVYLEASLLEVQRCSSLVPFGVPHAAIEDSTLAGYKIPKGTVILPFAEDIHKSPKYWEKPDDFYPEHFIEDGKLNTKKEGFIPFSVGRRVCIGENLAKMELFLFMAAILQRYTISQVPENPQSLNTEREASFIRSLKPYKVILTKRDEQQ